MNRKSIGLFAVLVVMVLANVVLANDVVAVNPFENQSFANQGNIFLLMVVSFLAGALSFFSPCTLPILPAYFAVTFSVDRKKIILMSLSFFMGLSTVFMIMGASASFLGQFLRQRLDLLTQIGGVFIIFFGIVTLLGRGFSGMDFQKRPSATFIGSFIFGSTFALGWTPCIGPILAGILVVAATNKTIFQGMLLLFFYALGLGMPLMIFSAFFGVISKESRFGKILKGKGRDFKIGKKYFYIHSTNLITGLLLIILGVFLATGYFTVLNSYIPFDLQSWFEHLEKKIINLL